MPEIDENFLKSIQADLKQQRKPALHRRHVIQGLVTLVIVVIVAFSGYFFYQQATVERALPPPPPPPPPQPTMPVSEEAQEEGEQYYLEHLEIRSAIAEYARKILRKELQVTDLGPLFQPIANFSWEKWYYDTVPIHEGFKTLKQPEPTPHNYVEESLITYTVQPDDQWGAWGVGVKYAAALGIDITNPKDKEMISLIAAYVWLQAQSRIVYEKENYFDEDENFSPDRPKRNINMLHAGDLIRFTHLREDALRELAQRPVKYLEQMKQPGLPEEGAPTPTPEVEEAAKQG